MDIELALIDQQVLGIAKNLVIDKDKNKKISKAFLYLDIKTLFEVEKGDDIFKCIY